MYLSSPVILSHQTSIVSFTFQGALSWSRGFRAGDPVGGCCPGRFRSFAPSSLFLHCKWDQVTISLTSHKVAQVPMSQIFFLVLSNPVLHLGLVINNKLRVPVKYRILSTEKGLKRLKKRCGRHGHRRVALELICEAQQFRRVDGILSLKKELCKTNETLRRIRQTM